MKKTKVKEKVFELVLVYCVGVVVIFLVYPMLTGKEYSLSILLESLLMALGIPIAHLLIK